VVVAVICTESKGVPDAVYVEPDGRASGGLMQVLNTTASDILKRTITVQDLKDPVLNIGAGVTYIYMNKSKTDYFDPILVAASYNSGGIYPPRSQDKNRFNLRTTGDHLERMIRWYGDACYTSKVDGWFKT
jgi:soluble lytic murein transglycosylase-like protein